MKLKVRSEYSDKNSCFELILLFKCPQKIFCKFYEHVQGIWELCLTQFFAVVKNRDHTTHQSDYIAKNVLGETMPFPSMFKINQSLHDLLRHKMSFICYERTKPETDLKSFVIAYCRFDQHLLKYKFSKIFICERKHLVSFLLL